MHQPLEPEALDRDRAFSNLRRLTTGSGIAAVTIAVLAGIAAALASPPAPSRAAPAVAASVAGDAEASPTQAPLTQAQLEALTFSAPQTDVVVLRPAPAPRPAAAAPPAATTGTS